MTEQFPREPSGQTSKGTLSIGPQPFWHLGLVSWKTILPWTRVEGMVWGSFKCICTLYFCYYISSTSDHWALDPRDWEPLDCKILSRKQLLSKQIDKTTKKYVHCYQRLSHGGGIMDGFYNLLRLIWMLLGFFFFFFASFNLMAAVTICSDFSFYNKEELF